MERDKVIEITKDLPPHFELDELIEKLIFIDKVEKGLQQLDEGKTIPHETVKELVKEFTK